MSVLGEFEADAGKVLRWLTNTEQKVQAAGPKVLAALGVLGGAVETAISDTSAAASNPTGLALNFGQDMTDFKAVWPDVKAFLLTLGIKV
jgi:hypothetical protein